MTTAESATSQPNCRFCGALLRHTFVDLGATPLCESFLRPDELGRMEPFFPLHVWVCAECLLVQLEELVSGEEIFGGEYAYFSSYSDSWVAHARAYAEAVTARLGLGAESSVVEVASNDGYLLQHFRAMGVPCLGIEPATNVAGAARAKGVETQTELLTEGFAKQLVAERGRADLVVGNNVFAHVPDLNDFTAALATLLAPDGTLTLEFPHLERLIDGNQFDTIYHEHFSYFSFLTARRVLAAHGLQTVDVEELPTHGGSLRLYAMHSDKAPEPSGEVARLAAREEAAGFGRLERYLGFGPRVGATKRALLRFLIEAREEGRQVVGYGAPGKGNTLLNYCGIGTDFLDYTVDRSAFKHGLFTPGTRIPIHPPERIAETRPDDILILPWNLREEIAAQLAYTREWGARLVTPIPSVEVIA